MQHGVSVSGAVWRSWDAAGHPGAALVRSKVWTRALATHRQEPLTHQSGSHGAAPSLLVHRLCRPRAQVKLFFTDVGKLPPPVLQFQRVTFGYSPAQVLYQDVRAGLLHGCGQACDLWPGASVGSCQPQQVSTAGPLQVQSLFSRMGTTVSSGAEPGAVWACGQQVLRLHARTCTERGRMCRDALLQGRPARRAQVDLGVDLDSRVALVGPNGTGKSTLLKLMCASPAPAFITGPRPAGQRRAGGPRAGRATWSRWTAW